MKAFDSFSLGKQKKGKVILPESSIKGLLTSPHVLSLRKKAQFEEKETSVRPHPTLATPFLDTPRSSQNQSRPSLSREKRNIFQEIRRMVSIGTVFLLLVFSGQLLGKVASFEERILPKAEQKVLSDVEKLRANISSPEKGAALSGLLDFSQELENSALYLNVYAQENPGDEMEFTSGFESSTELLRSAQLLSEAAAGILSEISFLEEQIPLVFLGQSSMLSILEEFSKEIELLWKKIEEAIDFLYSAAAGPIPDTIREKIQGLETLLRDLRPIYDSFQKNIPALKEVLGDKYPHTILFLLQNKNEIRGIGGFIGNTMSVVMNQGKVHSWKMTDIFQYSGQSTVNLPPPKEFAHLTGGWFIHDCNREPDFPSAAETCRWFLEHSRGETPDTIIALHQGFLEDLLNLTGPLPLPDAEGMELNSENYSFLLSYLTEAKILGEGGENSPKQFFENLLPEVLKRMQKVKPGEMISLFEKWRREKYVQAYSRDENLENLWKTLKVSGEFFPEKADDFLGVVQANVGGNKSDAFMVQDISEETLINASGEMFHTVKISRKHAWGETEEGEFADLFEIFGSPRTKQEDLRQIMGAGENKVYTTLYFPKGTKLLSTENITSENVEVREGENYAAFSFFFPGVKPGEEKEVNVFVSSPLKIDLKKGKVVEFSAPVQAGAGEQYFSKKFVFESGIQVDGRVFEKERFQENKSAVYLIADNL